MQFIKNRDKKYKLKNFIIMQFLFCQFLLQINANTGCCIVARIKVRFFVLFFFTTYKYLQWIVVD